MTETQRNIIRNYCRTATAIGVVLGPGVDAAPLAALWVAGFIHLADDADLSIDETEAKAAIAVLVAAFGAWFVSGKVAQAVAGMLLASGLVGAGISGGLSLLLAIGATLTLNATINAVFTYRFLGACANLMNDSDYSGTIFLKAFFNNVTHMLLSLAELPRDIVRCLRLMASSSSDAPPIKTERLREAEPKAHIDLLSPRYEKAAAYNPIDLRAQRYARDAAEVPIDLLSPRYNGREAGDSFTRKDLTSERYGVGGTGDVPMRGRPSL